MQPFDTVPARLSGLRWGEIESEINARGAALLPGLLDAAECLALRALFHDDARFEKTVKLSRGQGEGVYRFFQKPLPAPVVALREGVYGYAAGIWNAALSGLGRPERLPGSHAEFLLACAAAGQRRTTPALFRYGAGGYNELHRDIYGALFFPLQLVVALSEPGREFSGGDFVLAEEGRRGARLALSPGRGDGVLFCARDRPVRFGGRLALKAVYHGVAPVTAGERYAVGIPFHDYRGGP